MDLRKIGDLWEMYGVYLSAENKRQFYVPEGFAHGFLVTSEMAEFAYKCTDYYHPEDEGGIIWNDPDIAVQWPLDKVGNIILSAKDEKWQTLKETKLSF